MASAKEASTPTQKLEEEPELDEETVGHVMKGQPFTPALHRALRGVRQRSKQPKRPLAPVEVRPGVLRPVPIAP